MIKSLNSPKNMSAQYRPYRNEDGTECDQSNWNDQELGDVEIYQKTTEDIRVVSNRNLVVAGVGIGILSALLGLVIGYFAHSEHTECVASLAVAIHSVKDENPYIRKKILEIVSAERIEKYVKAYSTDSRDAGSAADKLFSRMIEAEWKENGLDKTEIVEYKVLLSSPDTQRPNTIRIINHEADTIFSIQATPKRRALPAFSAYSLPGNVSGNLVFVNHARLSDFKHLMEKLEINLEGKILIAKQSNLSADEQAFNAQLVKAAGLILYPDPQEYHPPIFKIKPYPNSWWLPDTVARTDSIFWNGVGDPLTPGYPAREDAHRLSMDSAALPQIIVQPISYADAFKLLSSLEGAPAPDSWQGGFNFTYKVGPEFKDPTWKVRMESYNKYVNKTVYNVIGTLRGSTEPDRYVIIGSHRDAWGTGALDAASGTASVLELTRVFGHLLLKLRWRPRRTIMFCSWGAEEYNLIGSTEWLEDNLKILQGRAVAYISADMPVSGNASVDVSASPLLYNAIYNATKEVLNPNEQEREEGLKTVYDAWLATFPQKRNSTKLLYREHATTFPMEELEDHVVFKRDVHNRTNLLHSYLKNAMSTIRPRVRRMDVKSNYAPFYVYAGIPAIDISYVHDVKTPDVPYPLYHTEHDTFALIKNFVDPTFKYHATVTKILGEVLRDLADSLFLPFNLFDYAQVLQNFYSELSTEFKDLEDFGLDLAHLEHAVKNFTDATFKFHATQESVDLSDPMIIRRINDQLLLLERAFLDHHGLPHNSFKKHIIMSPSESGPQNTFPGLIDEMGSIRYNAKDPKSLKTIGAHFSAVVFTIQSAAKTISDV